MKRRPSFRDRPPSWLVPWDARRLWIGLLIAVAGPIAFTPLTRLDPLEVIPGVPYMLVVVAATVFGRMAAAGVATILSVALLDRYVFAAAGATGGRTARDLVAIGVFILVAAIIAPLVVRLERAHRSDERELDRLAFLARAGDALSGSLDVDTTVAHLADVLVPTLADWFSVDLLDDEGAIRNLMVVHPDPQKLEVARELQRRFPADPDAATGTPNVIRTGRSELTEHVTDEMLAALIEDPELLAEIRALRLRCAITVPLTAGGRTFGALTLIGAETHDRYTVADLRLAEEIADRAALAVDRANLFAAERSARSAAVAEARRNEVLKDVTAAFGRATTVEEVMTAMLETGIRSAGAAAGTVGLVEGDRVDLLGISGYEVDDHPYWHAFGLEEDLPLAEAIRDRRPVVITTTAERDRRYPALIGRGEQRDHALVCLPLLLGGTAIGGFSSSYPPGTEFNEGDLTFLSALGEQCAQAIDRARSVKRERATRARFDALAAISRTLARTLDLRETTATIVRLTLDHLGAEATLYAWERGELAMLARGSERGIETSLDDGVEAGPAPDVVAAALVTAGQDRAPRLLDDATRSDDDPLLLLPLGIADSTIGVLVVAGLRGDVADALEFAREAARRMARALENARLYRERDYVANTLQRSLLPAELPTVPGLQVEALFRPAFRSYEVGGDFYDVFEVDDGMWAAVVGDVCGKGVEAATLTGLARHTLRAISAVEEPSAALHALNRALLREALDGRFITVVYALIEPDRDRGARVRIASAGHPLPRRITDRGTADPVGRPGTLLGILAEPHIEDVEIRLEPGEMLVLYTDGIIRRAEIAEDEPTGLLESLAGAPPDSATDARERVERYLDEVFAAEQEDDIAVLFVRAP